MKLFRWLIKPKHLQRLKNQQSSLSIAVEVESIRTSCILQIGDAIKPHWHSLDRILYNLGVTDITNHQIRINRDEYYNERILKKPAFSANQVASIWLNQIKFIILFPLFLVAETQLYYLQAALFVPGASTALKIIVAIFLTLLMTVTFGIGIEKCFKYREATEKHAKKEITECQLKTYRIYRNIGYVFIIISIAAILAGGRSRSLFLEWIPANGMEPARKLSVEKASKIASIFTLLVTLATAFYLGMLKHEQQKNGVQFKVMRGWQKAIRQGNALNQELILHANSILLIAEQHSRQYWGLIIELKRLFKVEVDTTHGELYREYLNLKAQPGFTVTNHIYAKFSSISYVDEDLFIWGILNCQAIKEKIVYAKHVLTIPKDHLREQLPILDKDISNHAQKSSNGKVKEYEFSTI